MIIKAKDYKVTKRDIVAKNQYLLDKLKLHKDVMRFLTNMTYNLSSEQRIKLEAS